MITDEAIAELAPLVGVRAACTAVGRPQANHYRRHRQSPAPVRVPRQRRPHPRALSPQERDRVRGLLNSPEFVDQAPRSAYYALLDAGVYLCSPSTMYRILHEHGEGHDDSRPRLTASRPPAGLPCSPARGRNRCPSTTP